MPDLEKEKIHFIKEHGEEIKPITKDPETLKAVEAADDFETLPSDLDPGRVEKILEEFETKVFLLEKSEYRPDQKRVLVEADNPGAYAAIKPLISALEKDLRCSGITALTSGVATTYLKRDFKDSITQIREKDKPVLVDILDSIEAGPVDVVLATISVKNAPDSLALFGSKGNLGAKKLFLVLESWGQCLNKVLAENKDNLEKIDGVFCNDELAKKIFQNKFPDIPPGRIYSFGTPILDSLDIEHADKYRKDFRDKLGIDEGAKVLVYLGNISLGLKNEYASRDDIDEQTFKDTFQQVVQLAEENPDKNFVFALRPHPRDPGKEEKYGLVSKFKLPKNLSFRDAGMQYSMNEVGYGSDIFLGIMSTENLLATRRGRNSVFLGFSGHGMGKEFLEKYLGKQAVEILAKESEGVSVAGSPEDLKKKLSVLMNVSNKESIPIQGNNTKRILDIILAS